MHEWPGSTRVTMPLAAAEGSSQPSNEGGSQMVFETLKVNKEGAVLFAEIAAPPMNLLGPELVRDLVSLIQRTEPDGALQVLVFKSADPDYFISHVDATRIKEHREEAAKLTGERVRSEEHTSELQSHVNLVCRL